MIMKIGVNDLNGEDSMKMTENKYYYMTEIDAKVARDLIKKYHYSHKVVPNSKLHLGVFD